MSKQAFVERLDNAASELRGTIRNWRSTVNLESTLGSLVGNLEGVSSSIKASNNIVVPEDTAKAIWKLMEAIDVAAGTTSNEDIERDVHVVTRSVRQFYFSHGALANTDGSVSFG